MKRLKVKKWDHEYKAGSQEWGRIQGKLLADFTREKIYIAIKGIGGDEITLSGDYETILRKYAELVEVIDQIGDELQNIIEIKAPEVWERFRRY